VTIVVNFFLGINLHILNQKIKYVKNAIREDLEELFMTVLYKGMLEEP
jgi:hypothetical protein